MSADDVVIASVGMLTAVGLSTPETAASVRAGTMRFTETELRDKRSRPFTLATAPDEGLQPLAPELERAEGLTARERRLLRLAARPLRECLAPLAERRGVGGLSLYLSLPELETGLPLNHAAFLQHLALQVNGAIDPKRSDASSRGRAGGLIAVGRAVAALRGGASEFVLAGGVDSFRDLWLLGALDVKARVKSDANLDGFVPGEGAAFLLLASMHVASAYALPILGCLSAVAMGFEVGHLESTEPYRGEGLAATFGQLVAAGAIEEPISEVYSSMNGESHWAKEWGVGYLRHKALFRPDHGMHHPADCFGDTGAASGPLMLGLAALGVRDHYRRSPALVYGSSDRGSRAAMLVSGAH